MSSIKIKIRTWDTDCADDVDPPPASSIVSVYSNTAIQKIDLCAYFWLVGCDGTFGAKVDFYEIKGCG